MNYVIYDQFHWNSPEHLEVHVDGSKNKCLEQYRFYKTCFPDESLGFVKEEYYIEHLRIKK